MNDKVDKVRTRKIGTDFPCSFSNFSGEEKHRLVGHFVKDCTGPSRALLTKYYFYLVGVVAFFNTFYLI